MRFPLIKDISKPHIWFAWFPVIAQRTVNYSGVVYEIVWLQKIRRQFVRVNSINVWQYSIIE